MLKLAVCSFAEDQFTHDPATRKAGRCGEVAQHFLFEGGDENWKDSAAGLIDDSHSPQHIKKAKSTTTISPQGAAWSSCSSVCWVWLNCVSRETECGTSNELYIANRPETSNPASIDGVLLLPMSLLMEGLSR